MFRKALIALALTPALAAAFLGLVVAVFAIPNAPILRNLTDRPEVLLARRADNGRVIDADTECIGMSVGLDLERDRPPLFERAVNAQSLYGCDALMRWIDGGTGEQVRDYWRYWHGYLLAARPVLAVMPYNDLRGYLFTLSAGLFLILLWRVGADFGARTALAFAAPFVVINAMGLWVVATKAVTWLLAIGGGLLFSTRSDPLQGSAPHPPQAGEEGTGGILGAQSPLLFFFILGALTAFFDFFTAPAFVFGFVAFVAVIYARISNWRSFLLCGIFFGAGWAGFILIKIAVAAAVLERNIWVEFWNAALFRMRGESEYVDTFLPGAAIYENFAAMKSFWGPVAVVAFLILPLATKARRTRWRALVAQRSVLFGIAAMPLLWLEVFSNHSQIHAAFTQINFAPLFILSALVLAQSPALDGATSGPHLKGRMGDLHETVSP